MHETKFCKTCRLGKSLPEFKNKKSGKFGVAAICKKCESAFRKTEGYREKDRERLRKNPEIREKRNKYTYRWKEKNKDKVQITQKKWFLKKLYGLTLDQYNEMFNSQCGACSICGKHQSLLEKSLSVDHDHNSGKIRSLLCSNCNTAIGLLDEDVGLLKKVVDYLNKHREG